MFDKRDVESYRNIKVPSELKSRILADCEAENMRGKRIIGGAFPSQRLIRSLSALAACFVLVVAIFSLTRMNTASVTLSYDGVVLSDERQPVGNTARAMDARATVPSGIPLEFKTQENTEIKVSGGSLYLVGEDSEDIVSLGDRAEIAENTVIWWAVEPGSETYELFVSADGEQTVYVLEINDQSLNGVIYKK